jgi:hypothetical protein
LPELLARPDVCRQQKLMPISCVLRHRWHAALHRTRNALGATAGRHDTSSRRRSSGGAQHAAEPRGVGRPRGSDRSDSGAVQPNRSIDGWTERRIIAARPRAAAGSTSGETWYVCETEYCPALSARKCLLAVRMPQTYKLISSCAHIAADLPGSIEPSSDEAPGGGGNGGTPSPTGACTLLCPLTVLSLPRVRTESPLVQQQLDHLTASSLS